VVLYLVFAVNLITITLKEIVFLIRMATCQSCWRCKWIL